MTQAPPTKVCKRCRAEVSADNALCPYDGWELEDIPPDPLVGKNFNGKYKIESVLGKGGMSVVYKARDIFMERIVAIKILHNHLVSDNSSRQRFQQEAQAAGSLNHPNVITVYDYGLTADDQAFLIMECFEGPTLADVLDQEVRITPDRGLRIFRQICDGLEHAHKKGIVHRDLKPSNLCLAKGEDGTEIVKIVDFGIAKLLPQDGKQRQQLTQTGQIFGSPLFMSPEQCQGKPLDQRSDLYSLGCLMYEALTGIPPFMGPTAFDTMNMHITESPAPMKKTSPEVTIPAELETPIMKLLEKDPNKRYTTAADVKADLPPLPEELAAGTKVWVPSWYSSIKHNPAARAALIACGVVLVIIIPLIPPFFLWPGPISDPGTPFEKSRWNVDIWLADRGKEFHNYEFAKARLDDAFTLAFQKLDLPKRMTTAGLESMLGASVTSDPNHEWFAYTQRAIDRVREAVKAIAMKHYENESQFYTNLGRNTTDSIERRQQIILSRAGQCEMVARELQALRFYPEEEKLLKLALKVDHKILPDTSWRVADLKSQLAECYEHMQYSPPVENLLLEALKINEKTPERGPESTDVLNTLLQLGQFYVQQSKLTDAKPVLVRAVKLATFIDNKAVEQLEKVKAESRKCAEKHDKENQPDMGSTCEEEILKAQQKLKEAKALKIEAYFTYADYLNQAGDKKGADQYFQDGNKLREDEQDALDTQSSKLQHE